MGTVKTLTSRSATRSDQIIPVLRPRAHPLGMPPHRRLRGALVGLGKQGTEDHLPAILASALAELVGVCDPDTTVLDTVACAGGVPGYADVQAMMVDLKPDFVVVAVPHHAGREIITAAAENGVHVLKEKPFALSLVEARELAAVCAEAGIEVMVSLQRRFNPIYTAFPQLCDLIGEPFLIDAAYTMTVDPAAGWRADAVQAGGGCVIDMGYHIIDLLLWYFGMPDRVLAQLSAVARPELEYDAEDTASITIGYDTGLFGTILLSRCVPPKTESLRVVGTAGAVHLQRGRIQRMRSNGDIVESLSRDRAWPAAAAAQIDHFCRVLRGERPNSSGPAAHLAHAAFVDACYQSEATGAFANPRDLTS